MITIEEAKEIMRAGLGRAELEFVTSLTAPLHWIIHEGGKKYKNRNGSAFFLDAGDGPFGVTANHVVEGWRKDCATKKVVECGIGHDLPIDLEKRLIDAHDKLDLATFRISATEIDSIRKTILTGQQTTWPPPPPQQYKGIYFSGFPGIETISLSPNEISFGVFAGGGVAHSISENDVSSLVERQHLIDVMGKGLPPESYDFRGMSGGPMLTVVEHKGVRSWRLAGVIYQGPNPSDDESQAIAGLEIFKARRADFILPNGKLNIQRWNSINVSQSPDE